MECDFSGWATKFGLKCGDGKTIAHGAFADQDGKKVTLVYMHDHGNLDNVLGHAILEARSEGIYAYCFLNDGPNAEAAKAALRHGDVNALSIWANQLRQRGGVVTHGIIRELSLVLAGQNPGAQIESITIMHGDVEYTPNDEAIIYTGEDLELSDSLAHAAGSSVLEKAETDEDGAVVDPDSINVQAVLDSMNEEQRQLTLLLVGKAVEASEAADETTDDNIDHSGMAGSTDTGDAGTIDTKDNTDMGKTDTLEHGVPTNVFDQAQKDKGGKKRERHYVSPEDQKALFHSALKGKVQSFRDHLEPYAEEHLEHGIDDIDLLFPDAHNVSNTPEFLQRRTEWVASFLGGTTKTPFSRIRTFSADITEEQARAKGYITGEFKKEEFFPIAKRVTTPTTVYKKQKLERDDLVDITDFDIVAWLKGEMRLMLDEEVARAGLIGDGRDIADEDKINEQNIRPIASDHELFTTTLYANLDDSNSSIRELVDVIVKNRFRLKGSGLPTMYTTETVIAKFLLLRDNVGRDIYRDIAEVATKLRVREIVPVEVMEEEEDILAVLVNPIDYTFGATRGGEVSLFDDFDIDYNQYKYLIETRCCGALTKLKSAMCIRKAEGNLELVVPAEPEFDGDSVTIINTAGVVYKNGVGATITNAGSPYAVPAGQTYTVKAFPDSGYYFETSDDDEWNFTNDAEA